MTETAMERFHEQEEEDFSEEVRPTDRGADRHREASDPDGATLELHTPSSGEQRHSAPSSADASAPQQNCNTGQPEANIRYRHLFSRDDREPSTAELQAHFKREIINMKSTFREEIKHLPKTATVSAPNSRSISDSVVASKPFNGKLSQNAESWFEYFEQYCAFRKLNEDDQKNHFSLLMQDSAADWLATLPLDRKSAYTYLKQAFKANYFKSDELKWKEAGGLWNQAQGTDERVEDFITRLRKRLIV